MMRASMMLFLSAWSVILIGCVGSYLSPCIEKTGWPALIAAGCVGVLIAVGIRSEEKD